MKKTQFWKGWYFYTRPSTYVVFISHIVMYWNYFIWTIFQFLEHCIKNILTNKKGGMADTSTREVVSCNTDLLLATNTLTTELSPQQLHQLYLCSLLLGRKKWVWMKIHPKRKLVSLYRLIELYLISKWPNNKKKIVYSYGWVPKADECVFKSPKGRTQKNGIMSYLN